MAQGLGNPDNLKFRTSPRATNVRVADSPALPPAKPTPLCHRRALPGKADAVLSIPEAESSWLDDVRRRGPDALHVGPPIVRVLAPVEATWLGSVATAAEPESGAGYAV